MMPRGAAFPALLVLLAVPACREHDAGERWLDEVAAISSPAGASSRYPHLAGRAPGSIVMSWLQALPQGGFALQHATWQGESWGPPGTVATGQDWFINWADFPSVVPVSATTWAAHWLQQTPGGVYSYDVRIAISTDAGATWTAPMSPHDDGTPTEHGFVSMHGFGGELHAVWLDGRQTSGEHDHAAGGHGAMTLRGAAIGDDGRRIGLDQEMDARVCDCCQTDSALTREGPVIVYRDRSEREVRDVALVRRTAGGWSAPVQVHADGWVIDACPVNGPAVDAHGDTVVVAWFTAPDVPRVRLAFSDDAGRSFSPPIEVASGKVAGRVDVVLLDDGRAIVSWLQDGAKGAEIIAQPFARDGATGAAMVIAGSSVHRSSGFPQMLRAGDGLLFAWTDADDPPRVRTAFARLH
jgi:hypothetical protein